MPTYFPTHMFAVIAIRRDFNNKLLNCCVLIHDAEDSSCGEWETVRGEQVGTGRCRELRRLIPGEVRYSYSVRRYTQSWGGVSLSVMKKVNWMNTCVRIGLTKFLLRFSNVPLDLLRVCTYSCLSNWKLCIRRLQIEICTRIFHFKDK